MFISFQIFVRPFELIAPARVPLNLRAVSDSTFSCSCCLSCSNSENDAAYFENVSQVLVQEIDELLKKENAASSIAEIRD